MTNLNQLRARLDSKGVPYTIIQHENPIRSVRDARQYFDIKQAAPVLILRSESGYYSHIFSGNRKKADLDGVQQALGCAELHVVSPEEVTSITGYRPGEIPLVGISLPCVLDNQLMNYPFVYGGTGDLYHTLKIQPQYLEVLNDVQRIIE